MDFTPQNKHSTVSIELFFEHRFWDNMNKPSSSNNNFHELDHSYSNSSTIAVVDHNKPVAKLTHTFGELLWRYRLTSY